MRDEHRAASSGAEGIAIDEQHRQGKPRRRRHANHPGVAAEMFKTLADNGINIEMISTSSIKISCVIERDQVEKAVRVLHEAFALDGTE